VASSQCHNQLDSPRIISEERSCTLARAEYPPQNVSTRDLPTGREIVFSTSRRTKGGLSPPPP
jgi:hypothetical protein